MLLFGKKAIFATVCGDIISQSEDAVVVFDKNRFVKMYNRAAERIFEFKAADMPGQQVYLLLPDSLHLEFDMMADTLAEGTAVERKINAVKKSGEVFLGDLRLFRASGDHFVMMLRDITRERKSEEELIRLATTDPLTGVYNRREFTAIAEKEALRSNRYGRSLSLLMMDIDYFKTLNDTHGHAAGDKALQKFAGLCCASLRNVDVFGRWGGEEFVALLPETDINGAAVIGERLRRLAEEQAFSFADQTIDLTVSVGITQFRPGETAIDAPLSRADSAVYEAKKTGRNRISVYRN